MNFEFTNGTTAQKSRWKQAAERLLNLPEDDLPLQIEVTFVDPSTLVNKGHTALAETTWTYGSVESTCEVRNDAPDFGPQEASMRAEAAGLGLPFNSARLYTEVAAHEIGHSAFASLPEDRRVEIAQMFGAKSDDIDELSPKGSEWQNRIIEGIAETFKEAFLPRRFRVFPNRTNIKLPYHRFPEFRSLFRAGIEESTGTGMPVPAYNLDVYRVNQLEVQTSVAPPEGGPFDFIIFSKNLTGFGEKKGRGLLEYSILDWGPIEANDNTLWRRYFAEAGTQIMMLPRGTNIQGTVELPYDEDYFSPSPDWGPVHGEFPFGFEGFFGTFTERELWENPEFSGLLGPWGGPPPERILGVVAMSMIPCYYDPADERWHSWDLIHGGINGVAPIFLSEKLIPHPNFPDDCWIIVKRGEPNLVYAQSPSWSIPVGTLSINAEVPSDAPTVDTCGGPMVKVRVLSTVTLKTAVSRQPSIETIQSRLPSFTLSRGQKPCKGGEIILPEPLLVPGGANSGARPHGRPVVGNFG